MRLSAIGVVCVAGVMGVLVQGGCSSAPAEVRTGFISDYSKLQPVSETRSRYISPELKKYDKFIVDPVQWRTQGDEISLEDRAKIVNHFRETFVKVLRDSGYTVVDAPAAGAARIRIAVTNIHTSTWWQKVHPASSLAGAGRGGAACEGEVIDSVTGTQLAAFVVAGVGSQFTFGNYSTTADVNNVIDQWAQDAATRLKELREQK